MSGMFDDASESEDEDAQISVVPSPAVAAGLPVHGSTTQQPAKERCHIMGPQLSLPEQAGTAEPPLLCSDWTNELDSQHSSRMPWSSRRTV